MKKFIAILALCLACAFCAMSFIACGGNEESGDSTYNNTYYQYSNGYDEANYWRLKNGKFEWHQTMSGYEFPIISGTYEVQDGVIDFYVSDSGTKSKIYTGSITEGVLHVASKTYCARGYTPQG